MRSMVHVRRKKIKGERKMLDFIGDIFGWFTDLLGDIWDFITFWD